MLRIRSTIALTTLAGFFWGKKIAKTWRKQQIIVGIVGFKAYLCHCFIKIIAIPLIIKRIAILFSFAADADGCLLREPVPPSAP